MHTNFGQHALNQFLLAAASAAAVRARPSPLLTVSFLRVPLRLNRNLSAATQKVEQHDEVLEQQDVLPESPVRFWDLPRHL